MVFVPIENSVALIMLGQTVVCLILWSFVVGAVNCIGYEPAIYSANELGSSPFSLQHSLQFRIETIFVKKRDSQTCNIY